MFRSIAATVVFVKDMDPCKTFYRDTLGLELKIEGGPLVLRMSMPPTRR